jgi:uncharacterized protein YheU (UPF0270 family)
MSDQPDDRDDRSDDEAAEPVIVPPDQLSPATLDKLLAEVALRDDTDYGDRPRSLEERVVLSRQALARGELAVVFDPSTETVAVLTRDELDRRRRR